MRRCAVAILVLVVWLVAAAFLPGWARAEFAGWSETRIELTGHPGENLDVRGSRVAWAAPRRLLRNDAAPSEHDGRVREKDAESARSSATGATEDALSGRPVRSGGQGFVLQQPPKPDTTGGEGGAEVWVVDGSGAQPTRVADLADDVSGLRLGDDLLVWSSRVDGDQQVFAYDFGTGETVTLGDDSAEDWAPLAGGRWVVWTPQRSSEPWGWSISAHDLESGVTSAQVFPQSSDGAESMDLDGDLLVWSESDGHDDEVFVRDLAAGRTTRLSDNAYDDRYPRVAAGRVVWLYQGYEAVSLAKVMLVDTASGERTSLYQGSGWISEPAIDGRWVVWGARPGPGRLELIAHDLESGQRRIVPTTGLVWPDLEAGLATCMTFSPPSNSQVLAWDLSADTLTQLSNDRAGKARAVSGAGRAVWVSLGVSAGPGDSGDERVELVIADAPTATPPSFADVPGTHPYRTAIVEVRDAGIAQGYPSGSGGAAFRPEEPVLRAQFAKMVVLTLGLSVTETYESPFADIGPDASDSLYPHDYVAVAHNARITEGTAPGVFSPWAPISRAQLVTMVVRGIESREPGTIAQPPVMRPYSGTVGDFDPGHAPFMRLAEYNGLLDGLAGFDRGWDPWLPATRGEVAQILWNVLCRFPPSG